MRDVHSCPPTAGTATTRALMPQAGMWRPSVSSPALYYLFLLSPTPFLNTARASDRFLSSNRPVNATVSWLSAMSTCAKSGARSVVVLSAEIKGMSTRPITQKTSSKNTGPETRSEQSVLRGGVWLERRGFARLKPGRNGTLLQAFRNVKEMRWRVVAQSGKIPSLSSAGRI